MKEYVVKKKPVVSIGGVNDAQVQTWNQENRFGFVPREKPCPVCGGNTFAYTAFAMNDGRQTVRWICQTCGKNDAMAKVEFAPVYNRNASVNEIVKAVLEAFAMDSPPLAGPIRSAYPETKEEGGDKGYIEVTLHFAKKCMMQAKLVDRKLPEIKRYFNAAFDGLYDGVYIAVSVDDENPDSVPGYDVFNRVEPSKAAIEYMKQVRDKYI